MGRLIDIAGQRFSRLVVLRKSLRPSLWECLCDCGTTIETDGNSLRRGMVQSCGCIQRRVAVGARFGWLVVLESLPKRTGEPRLWRAQCDCGTEKITRGDYLTTGHTTSCGCQQSKAQVTHGRSKSRLYKVWTAIKGRCLNPKEKTFYRYGGRGITVCAGWRDSFPDFAASMGPRPSPKHSIDRRDNDGGYWCGKCEECVSLGRPANCRWATPAEQNSNTRVVGRIQFRGEVFSIVGLSRLTGIPKETLRGRLRRGLSPEEAARKAQ